LPVYHGVDRSQRVPHLRDAVVDPGLVQLLRWAPVALVGCVKTFVARAHHDCSDFEHGAPVRARSRRECAVATIGLIEMVDDGATVDQRLATVEHQRRDAAERIPGPHLGAVVEAGKRLLLEGHAIDIKRDRDAARKRRAVRPDQQHLGLDPMRAAGRSAAHDGACTSGSDLLEHAIAGLVGLHD
jgi:hypothetical protein